MIRGYLVGNDTLENMSQCLVMELLMDMKCGKEYGFSGLYIVKTIYNKTRKKPSYGG